MMNRRNLLSTLPVLAIAACGVTTVNGITTATLDTAKINNYAQAFTAVLTTVITAPAIMSLLGPNLVAAEAGLAAVKLAATELATLTGGSLSVSIDTTKVQATVTSLLNSVQTVLTLVQSAIANLKGAAATKVQNYLVAVLTLIPLMQLAAGFVSLPKATQPLMTEEEALKIAYSK